MSPAGINQTMTKLTDHQICRKCHDCPSTLSLQLSKKDKYSNFIEMSLIHYDDSYCCKITFLLQLTWWPCQDCNTVAFLRPGFSRRPVLHLSVYCIYFDPFHPPRRSSATAIRNRYHQGNSLAQMAPVAQTLLSMMLLLSEEGWQVVLWPVP